MKTKPEVVITGLSGRFPAADSLDEFEYKLFNKIEMVTVDDSRWPVGLFNLPKKNGKIGSIDRFDAEFFEFPENIVNYIDPQERLFLECTYESLIDAGIDPESLRGSKTGFFWGSCFLETHGDFDDPIKIPKTYRTTITRVSNFFDFKGPIHHSDTACNSSLNALNDAFINIQSGQCDRAIVAGSNTCFRPLVSLRFRDMKMITKDGTCKCLDESADGYCRSEAIVVVLLERKDLAKRIYATVLNSKSGSDGFKEEGITFPSMESQRRLTQETYDEIGLNPADIGYIESHVTGTSAGDPVEMNAVYDVICTKKKEPLLIGCIKSNIGHSEGASGLCSLAKACIIMQTRLIPPNLHFKKPNPNIRGLMDGKMKPVTEVTPLPGTLIPINSFGFGGANTHVVIEGTFKKRSGSVASPVPRLVNAAGRTMASASYILSRIEKESKYLNNDFFYLLSSFSRVAKNKMTYRAYMIIVQEEGRISFENVQPQKVVTQERPWLVFRQLVSSSVKPESLLNISMFKKSLNEFLQYLPEKFHSNPALETLSYQVAWIDTLKELAFDPQGVLGYGIGALSRAYFEGNLSKKQVAEAALLLNDGLLKNDALKDSLSRIASQLEKQYCEKLAAQMSSKDAGLNGTPTGSFVLEAGPAGLFERGENKEEESLLRSIRTLGRLYMDGQDLLIEKLYPAVEFPIPSNTPSLGSLLQWDHHKEYSIKPYLVQDTFFQKSKKIVFRCDRRHHDDSFFYDHKIDERILFPATGYLMLAWTAFAKFSNVSAWDIPIEFKDVAFMRATVMNKYSETSLSTVINEGTGDFVISEGDTVVVTGCIRYANAIKPLEIPDMDEKIVLDAKQIYREFRVRGYDYGSYFQGLLEAESDGRQGKLIWRDVMAKSIKDALSTESDDEHALLWTRSWVAFVDSMFQLDLLREEKESRLLFVPTRIDSLICIPDLLNQSIQSSPKITDALTLSEASIVTAKCYAEQIWTKGIWIRGLKTTQVKRKLQVVCEVKDVFVPLAENSVLDMPNENLINKYVAACERALEGNTDLDFNLKDPKCILLKSLISGEKLDLSTDYLAGNFDDEFFYNRTFLYPLVHLVTNSMAVTQEMSPLDVLEVNSSKHIMAGKIFEFWNEVFLFDSIKLTYSLIHPDPSHLDPTQVNGVQVITSPNMSFSSLRQQSFIIFKWGHENSMEVLQSAFNNLSTGGFFAVLAKDRTRSNQIKSLLDRIGVSDKVAPIEEIISNAEKSGFVLIKQQMLHDMLPLKAILFRKRRSDLESIQHRVIEVGVSDHGRWFEDLKLFMREENEAKDKRVWLVPRRDVDCGKDSCVTGIVGLTKSLRLEEGGERIRCIVDFTTSKVDINDPKYQEVIQRDLTINIYDRDLNCWGFNQPIPITNEELVPRPSQYAYLRSLKQGDMSSLTWVESDLKTVRDENNNMTREGTLIDVHYSALNFRDIMFASGQLDSEAIPGIHPDIAQDSILGLEFSGIISESKKRVMGICPYKALATKVFVEQEEVDFTWPVPDDWSLEDAATVPVVYATAYYALIIRGRISPNENVLIHSGCGGVGLAAISICLSMGCTVYTTCGSDIKRKYLSSNFPELVNKGNKIFNSRSISFEEQILMSTDGRGVDVVLNSLAEDKLQASLRCLAANGRFLEIGKVDFVRNHALYAHQMSENQSFHGVLLDALFKYKTHQIVPDKIIKEKRWLKELLTKGIAEGTVRPLDRTVFQHTQMEDAFRYMTTGRHIGKVLVQIRTPEDTDIVIPSLKATYCYPTKSYIVLGGLGGFGLELVQWLALKGARLITIASRSGIREAFQKYSLVRLKRMGVKVRICTADITKEEGCRELLMQSMEDGPVGGIFNAAVIYKDKLYQDQTISVFKEVCGPKSEATRHFDKLSRSLCPQLDYFLTFSSLSANRGNAGQTNYNFANSVMDSICQERVRDGLPGLSIQWGVVGDVGIVADSANSNEMVLLGSRAQRMHSCFDFIDKYLQAKYPICVSYVKAENDSESGSSSETIDILSVITRLLGLKDLSSIDSEMTLGGLGVDSLIAVEIKQALDKTFGSSISIREVRDLTIAALMKMSSSTETATTPSSKPESSPESVNSSQLIQT